MRFSSSFCDVIPSRVVTFHHSVTIKSVTQSATMDVEIPLAEDQSVDELIAHIFVQNKILPPFRDAFREAFMNFVDNETYAYEDEMGDAAVDKFLSGEEDIDVSHWVQEFSRDDDEAEKSSNFSFGDCFDFIMHNSSHERIQMIISTERKMAGEMSSLIRARDFELERLTRHCEAAIKGSATLPGGAKDTEAQQLSLLNSKIRSVSANYAKQIQALTERQVHDYRKLIISIYERDEIPSDTLSDITTSCSSVRKSTSAFANMVSMDNASKGNLEESFTIYLGAQLKTMHNARIISCRNLSDICRPPDVLDSESFDTHRFHTNLCLYRRGLTGLVLLVGKDPDFHLQTKSNFSKICELSSELHFDSLKSQLESATKALQLSHKTSTSNNEDRDNAKEKKGYQTGEVYITKHSNLSIPQVVFHLVVDDDLATSEINSRHPCLNGLRNVIRLSSKFGITTFYIPLLLIENTSEVTTVPWCLKRAELVFKCVKGFMMESCAATSVAGGPPLAATHYNVNFVIPEELDENVRSQLVDMFPTIFHLVPSVTV
ncbi:hypothetical protein AB6A40_001241 [Gnathostoma spinigerum]|uniref:Uncharacterized protein n=1 Tax=Gnathostoma spinigerum TaxID=75299 RepID=A0ABD6E5U8_9BILA